MGGGSLVRRCGPGAARMIDLRQEARVTKKVHKIMDVVWMCQFFWRLGIVVCRSGFIDHGLKCWIKGRKREIGSG